MPKLNKETAHKVSEQEGGSFEPLPPGTYPATLHSVEVKEGQAAPYWAWVFKVADGEYKGRQLWLNTSLSEAALFRLQEVFAAFGVSPDTDTDELCGRTVQLRVGQRTIQGGSRAGEIGNDVQRVLPLPAAGAGNGRAAAAVSAADDGIPF